MSGDDSNCDSTFAVPQADIYKFARRTFKGQPVEDLIPHQFGSSVVIPKELFEAMYLDPDVRTRRHLRSGFGNPTPMALMGFLIASTPLGCNLMGWRGSGGEGAAIIGPLIFFGGMLQILGCVLEWILGNTFHFVVFAFYGAFWLAMGATLQPDFNAQGYYVDPSATLAAQASGEGEFYASFGFFFMAMSIVTSFFVIASLRTNILLVLILLFVDLAFLMLTACYWNLARGIATVAQHLQIAAGAFIFVFCMIGYYLLFSLILLAVDFPFVLPIGDLSTKIKSATDRRNAIEAKV